MKILELSLIALAIVGLSAMFLGGSVLSVLVGIVMVLIAVTALVVAAPRLREQEADEIGRLNRKYGWDDRAASQSRDARNARL
jgi:Zn-dependent protease with chaperone function